MVSRAVLYLEYTVVIVCLATMASITFINVISRYFLNLSLAFTEEITVNLFVVLTFFGASIAIYRGGHLGFTWLYDKINYKWKITVTIITGLLVMLLFFVITYFGVEITLGQYERNRLTPALNWPQWMFQVTVPIGSLLCLCRTGEVTFKRVNLLLEEGK